MRMPFTIRTNPVLPPGLFIGSLLCDAPENSRQRHKNAPVQNFELGHLRAVYGQLARLLRRLALSSYAVSNLVLGGTVGVLDPVTCVEELVAQ